jgi:hypothetical protein
VGVWGEQGRTVFAVKSPIGIGQAVIERQEATWPQAVVLRLCLKGLLRFRASNGTTALNAVASIQDGKPKVRLWQDDKEDAPLDEKSPLWMEVRSLGGSKPAQGLPLKDGYFEVALPRALFEGNPKGLPVTWVDFSRN